MSLNLSGRVDLVGQYSYALAISGVFLMAGQMGMRQLVMSKLISEQQLSQIFVSRLFTSLIAYIFLVIYTLVFEEDKIGMIILSLGLLKFIENLSDISHGLFQRNYEAKKIAVSRMLRSLLCAFTFIMVFYFFEILFVATLGLFSSVLIVFLIVDAKAFELSQFNLLNNDKVISVVKASAPMGIATFLIMLLTNIPIFFLANYWPDKYVGQYASIFYLVTAGSLIFQSAIQVLSPIFISLLNQRHFDRVKTLLFKLYAGALLFGLIGFIAAMLASDSIIPLMYGEQFEFEHQWILIAAGINLLLAIQSVGGVFLTAAGVFNFQLVAVLSTATLSLFSSLILVSMSAVSGALFVSLISNFVLAMAFILRAVWELKHNERYSSSARRQ